LTEKILVIIHLIEDPKKVQNMWIKQEKRREEIKIFGKNRRFSFPPKIKSVLREKGSKDRLQNVI